MIVNIKNDLFLRNKCTCSLKTVIEKVISSQIINKLVPLPKYRIKTGRKKYQAER